MQARSRKACNKKEIAFSHLCCVDVFLAMCCIMLAFFASTTVTKNTHKESVESTRKISNTFYAGY